MKRITLAVGGMSCGHCVAAVRRALEAVPGVTVEEVVPGSARVAVDPARTGAGALATALEGAGYPARVAGGAG